MGESGEAIMNNIYADLMKLSKETLAQKLVRTSWNEEFGCFNKTGFEENIWPEIAPYARYILFFDIDYLKKINDQYDSYKPVNALIKRGLSVVREEDGVAAQVNSGDEILVCVLELPNDHRDPDDRRKALDPEGLKARLVEGFASVGMSATFAIVPVKSWDLAENLEPAIALVKALKKERGITR